MNNKNSQAPLFVLVPPLSFFSLRFQLSPLPSLFVSLISLFSPLYLSLLICFPHISTLYSLSVSLPLPSLITTTTTTIKNSLLSPIFSPLSSLLSLFSSLCLSLLISFFSSFLISQFFILSPGRGGLI